MDKIAQVAFPEPDIDTIDRFLAGTCTPTQESEVRGWAGASLADNVRAELQRQADIDVDVSAMARRITEQATTARERFYALRYVRRWLGYGGVVTAGLVVGLLSWNYLKSGVVQENQKLSTYSTRAGQRASIMLADGSKITLGPATTLQVQVNKENNSVVTDVTGEALFTVNHTARHPFIVTSHGVTTRVLGTEFVVRAYDASNIRVAVRDGRVSVQSASLTVTNASIVVAGEAASITSNTVPTISRINDLATEFAWANGELVLRDVPLGEAVVRLSRWYGIEFKVAEPSLLKARVGAVFPTSFNRTDIEIFARAIGAKVNQSAGILTFY